MSRPKKFLDDRTALAKKIDLLEGTGVIKDTSLLKAIRTIKNIRNEFVHNLEYSKIKKKVENKISDLSKYNDRKWPDRKLERRPLNKDVVKKFNGLKSKQIDDFNLATFTVFHSLIEILRKAEPQK